MISPATVNLSTTALKFGPPIPPFTTAPHRFVQRILFILPTTVTTIWNPITFRCPHPQYIRPAIQNSISVGTLNWAAFAYLQKLCNQTNIFSQNNFLINLFGTFHESIWFHFRSLYRSFVYIKTFVTSTNISGCANLTFFTSTNIKNFA